MTAAASAVARGSTLWVPDTGPVHDPHRGHIFIVLTDPDRNGLALLIPVCSAHPKCDDTCKLGPGDHPFLKKPSFADYNKMQILPVAKIEERIAKGEIVDRGPFHGTAFAYICAGIEKSRKCAPKYRAYYAAQQE